MQVSTLPNLSKSSGLESTWIMRVNTHLRVANRPLPKGFPYVRICIFEYLPKVRFLPIALHLRYLPIAVYHLLIIMILFAISSLVREVRVRVIWRYFFLDS